jgi:hypothetical protein
MSVTIDARSLGSGSRPDPELRIALEDAGVEPT